MKKLLLTLVVTSILFGLSSCEDNEQIPQEVVSTTQEETKEPAEGNQMEGILYDSRGVSSGRIEARRRVRLAGVGLYRSKSRNSRVGESSASRTSNQSDWQLIGYTQTNDNGAFGFSNVTSGRYRIQIDYPGIPLDESSSAEFRITCGQSNLNFAATVDGTSVGVESNSSCFSTSVSNELKIPFSVLGSTVGQSNNYNVNGSDGADVFFWLTIDKWQWVTLSTCHSETNYDTKVEWFSASGQPYAHLYNASQSYRNSYGTLYNDDGCSNYRSKLSTFAAPGRYRIVVDGYSGKTGSFKLTGSLGGSNARVSEEIVEMDTTGTTKKFTDILPEEVEKK